MKTTEQKSESTLMKKTKKELIEIILRKDDVELRLKSNVDNLKEEVDQLNNRIVGYESDVNGYQRHIDDNAERICVLEEQVRHSRRNLSRWRTGFIILAIAAIAIIAIVA